MIRSSQIRRQRGEDGYVLLVLLLIIALMAIVAATVVTSVKFDIQRDREEEMIHRGVQYSRAIKAYYKKFNRYPAKIEDLENTNQMRFLRKRYKDPLTGKDFRLLHYGEAKLALGGMSGGTIPGANAIGANGQLVQAGGAQTSGAFGGNNTFGQNSAFGQNSSFGQNSNSTFGQNNQQNSNNSTTDSSQTGNAQDSQGSQAVSENGSDSGDRAPANQQVQSFGGAPIVGVASTSKERTIREYDKKKKYNEWQFVYDPTMDRGGLITTPYQPQLAMQGFGQGMQNLNGQTPNGANPNGNGFGNGFGNNSGFSNSLGNSPGGMQNTPQAPPTQLSNPPQQQ